LDDTRQKECALDISNEASPKGLANANVHVTNGTPGRSIGTGT